MANAWAMRPLPMAAITAGSTASGYAAANMANDMAGVVWKSAGGAASVTITVDMGVPQRIDAALFFGCTNARAAWTLTVESADDSGFTVNEATHASAIPFLAGSEFPTHGRGVGWWVASAAINPRRYWRFTIGGLSNAQVTIARIAIGARMQLERNFAFGGGWGVRDLGSVEFSTAGVRVRRQAARLRTLGLNFPAVTKDEAETKVQPLLELVAGQLPIVLVENPDADALRQRRCWFGHLIGDLGRIWRNAAQWEWRANLIDLVPIPADVSTAGAAVFDFSNAEMPSGATLTRASAGTRWNAAGALVSETTNAARFDYNPATLAYRGLLIEPTATNSLLQSQDLTTGWTGLNVTFVSTGIRETTTNGQHRFGQFQSSPGSGYVTTSFIASELAGSAKRYVGVNADNGLVTGYVIIDLATGTVTATGGLAQTSITPLGGGNYLISVTFGGQASGGANPVTGIYLCASPTSMAGYAGSTSSGMNISELQYEGGSSGVAASSRIRTTSSAVTRAADVLTLDWASRGVADGVWTVRYTFDDGSTQDVTTAVAGGTATVPTNLNRRHLRMAEKI